MQTKVITPDKTFKPVTIQLTFETVEELSIFKILMSSDKNVGVYFTPEVEKLIPTWNTIVNSIYPQIVNL